MLTKEGFVDGVSVKYGAKGDIVVSVSTPMITLKGIEYLHENSFMKKAGNIAKGLIDVIPKV